MRPEWTVSMIIEDLTSIIREIDDVLPNGRASRLAHMIKGKWKAVRWNYEDRADKDAIKYREEHYDD